MKTRFTTWSSGYKIAEALGLQPDKDSAPELSEWYYTLSEHDANAFAQLLYENLAPFVFSTI